MMKPILALSMVAALAGCASTPAIFNTSLSPQSALVAANAFDALEVVATGYLTLPPCGPTSSYACRSASAVARIAPAVRSGRVARNQIEGLLDANKGGAIPVASITALQAVNTTLQAVYTQYSIH